MLLKEKMDIPRGPTIALPIPNTVIHIHHRRGPLSRSSSQSSSDSGRPSTSMTIPGARINDIPPALPPPRYNNDLDDGFDLAWKWQNEHLMPGKSKLAPIKPGSSLLGPPSCPQLARDDDKGEDTDVDLNSLRAASSPSRSYPVTATSIPSLMRSPPSSSGISQRLHGENPLAQQNHIQSTHAYDKHLLLRIGKSNSPPGHHKSSSQEQNIPPQHLSIQTKRPSLLLRPVNDPSSAFDPVTKWMASPTSTVSSTPRYSWRESSMDARSPSSDIHQQSATLDPDLFLAPNPPSTHYKARSSQAHSPEDTKPRSERGSHDSAIYASDTEYIGDEASLGSLHIEERPRPIVMHHGIKRRALSPTPDLLQEHRTEAQPTRLQRTSGAQGAAPRQPYRAASLSSTASSAPYNSYNSSTFSSFAHSSATTLSSLDTPVSREYSHQSAVSPTTQSARGSAAAIIPLRPVSEKATAAMSTQSTSGDIRTPPARIGNFYICSCCPKKPKKFDTEQQLRAHETEKQYTCAYCNNRFKNKNEAERHQNSLHLRKQSWSCATISTYQAAFHPSSFSNPRNLTTDTCGFCGEEFNNHLPNWEERIEHLTNTHKFGECNATKKFYRADHFRQHLKHSHAGKSGKWTNILENSCQREESIMSDSASLSPTASEHSQSGSGICLQGSLVNPVDASMSGVDTIDEVHEES